MAEKRFTIKPQDDLFGVVDNYSADKVCVINGIRTEIEAEWLCKDMNALNDENEKLKQQKQQYKGQRDYLLFVIERSCSKELFEETKSYLKKVE